MDAYRTFALVSRCYHYDSSSFSVHEEYDNETVLDQRKRPTQTPTLRCIFQSFQAIHRVVRNGQVHISI